MFSVSTIKNNLKIVRPNLFFAELILPVTFTGAYGAVATNTFKYRCESTELPGRTISTADDMSFGSATKHAYEVTYNDLTLSIIASEDMNERRTIETWMDNIVKRPTTTGTGGLVKYYNDYASGQINIYQLNENKEQLVKCTLNRAFPIALGPLNMTWEENDTYQRFSITFAYRWHTLDFTKTSLASYFS